MYHPAAPGRIAALLPDVKLIAVLRDPVERAWSQYRYEVARGHETESFENALRLEPERLSGERERLSTDPHYDGFPYCHHGYLERGHDADQLKQLYARFPREQVLVLNSDEMFGAPDTVLSRVWDSLGPEQVPADERQARNANASSGDIPAPSLAFLTEYYRPTQ